jgi:hypothetical protein
MSEEKKPRAGDVQAAQQQQPQSLRIDVKNSPENEKIEPSRARNQDVLPGILGKQLRSAYGELLNAPVPDAITSLIEQLKSSEPNKADGSSKKPDGEESGQ